MGNAASCLYWQTIAAYLTFFYTDIFGIGAAAAGAMIGLSRIADAFFDPVMGMLADRASTRWGRFRPFLLWFCVPLAIVGVLTFTVPGLSSSGKLAWAYATYNALMLIYTAINIPYIAMMGVMSPNPNDRTVLASSQFVGAFLGGLVVSASLLPMSKVGGWLGATTVQRGWQMAFVIYGIAAVMLFLATFLNTRERITPPKQQQTSVLRDLGDLLTNGPWLIVLATTLTFVLFSAIRTSVTAYYFKYFVGSQALTLPSFFPRSTAGTQVWSWESLVAAFGTSGQVASLVGVILIPLAARVFSRKILVIALFAVSIASTAAIFLFRPDQLALNFVVNLLGSAASGPLSALLWTMYADTADYAEWKRGRRATGLVFSASIFSQKQGGAIGAWIALALMQSVGFVANTVQTPRSLHGLVLLMSVIPASIGVLSLFAVLFYPLNERRMAQIASDLGQRRALEAETLADQPPPGASRDSTGGIPG